MFRVIVKSDPFPSSRVIDFTARLEASLASTDTIRASRNYLEKQSGFDGTGVFDGATAYPIGLENYAEDCREELAAVARYSSCCSGESLLQEVEELLSNVVF